MKYQLYAKNLELTEMLKKYLEHKLAKLDKFLTKAIKLEVELSRDSRHQTGPVFRAEFNLSVPKKLIRIEERDFNINSAIDKAVDQLVRQVEKAKDKNLTIRKLSEKFS